MAPGGGFGGGGGGGAPSWSAKFSQQRRGRNGNNCNSNGRKTPSSSSSAAAGNRSGGWKKRRRRSDRGTSGTGAGARAADLESKVSTRGGRSGYLLNAGGGDDGENVDPRPNGATAGHKNHQQLQPRVRKFASSSSKAAVAKEVATPAPARASGAAAATANPYKTPAAATASGRKKYSARGTPYSIGTTSSKFTLSSSTRTPFGDRTYSSYSATPATASTSESGGVHVVCAISENLARETCLACIDAGMPVELRITKQGNGNTYGETLACLEWLKPDEILLNEGRRTSQLAIKVMSLYNQRGVDDDGGNSVVAGGGNDEETTDGGDDRSTATRIRRASAAARASDAAPPPSNTVVKFLPRHYFDQTRGAELLRRVCRKETQRDSSVTEEYILLASSHAALHYAAHCLGATFSNHSVALAVNSTSTNCNRMVIDRGTLMQLELLANARTGASRHSLIGTIDCTRTTVGSRLLRRTIMAPPVRLSTIEARLDLVDSLLADEEFFYAVMEHLEAMPGLDKMMSHMALVPKVSQPSEGGRRRGNRKDPLAQDNNGEVVTERMAARGIEALICIKSTLSVLPSFAAVVADQLKVMEARDAHRRRKEREEGRAGGAAGGMDVDDDDEDDDDDAGSSGDDDDDDDDDDDNSSSLGSGSGESSSDEYDDRLIADDDGTVTTGHFTFMGELTLTSSPATEGTKRKRKRRRKNKGRRRTTRRHPPNSLLLRAILHTMRQPALGEILDAVRGIFTESTTYSKNSHAMRHQECFALKPNTDGMMDILRKAFLANVDDIYRLADEYSERYGVTVAVRETTSRGYYLSIPASFAPELPPVFIQPVRTGRFIHCTTEEVHSLNARARENVQDLLIMTHGRIQEVIDVARVRFDALASLCDAIALLDMTHCFADNVASSRSPWCRPVVTDSQVVAGADAGGGAGAGASTDQAGGDDDRRARGGGGADAATGPVAGGGGAMAIRNGRYAIDVSGSAGDGGHADFVPNDTYAAAYQNFTIITGVNGSGKSTYLKQIAIIVVLAHCGSYVPAEEAFIPIRDRLLTRIGTSDDQEHNISTFMLEMKETASVCNQATDKSLILIDELGRATSNEDGVAIAWAVSEFLLVKRAMTFFVTHYPQLSRLADVYPNVQNQHLGTTTVGDELQYTHKILPGPCEMAADYGVEMAGACGWPIDVVRDARSLRAEVEKRLPDGALCQRNSGPNVELLEVRVTAEGILTDIAKYLVALKEGRLSREAQRSYLQDIRDRLIPSQDNDVVEMIKSLLLDDEKKKVSTTLHSDAAAQSLYTKNTSESNPEAAKDTRPSSKKVVVPSDAQEKQAASSSETDGAASSQDALLSGTDLAQPVVEAADLMEESSEGSSDSNRDKSSPSSSDEDDDSSDGDESESNSKDTEDSSSYASGSDDGSESDSSEGGSCDIDDSGSEKEK